MLLDIQNATMRFGGLLAVNNVSLQIEKGGIYALIGPNGAGKTTLFNMIAGAFKPTSGKFIMDGRDITGFPSFKVNHAGISRTYQNINLFKSMTVVENIMVGCHPQLKSGLTASVLRLPFQRREEKKLHERCHDLLTFVGLEKKAFERSSSLSYGEQRKLEIARGMASAPKLMLLDEPAAGMNYTEKQELVALIRRMRDDYGITILIVDHEMQMIMSLAEHVFVLNFGEKIAEGTPEEVQKSPDVISAYLGEGD